MATTTPPFQVEDQTDEDFFDKLVDDDDVAFRPSGLVLNSVVDDGLVSNEAKACPNDDVAIRPSGSVLNSNIVVGSKALSDDDVSFWNDDVADVVFSNESVAFKTSGSVLNSVSSDGLGLDEAKAFSNDDVAIRLSGSVLNSVVGDGSNAFSDDDMAFKPSGSVLNSFVNDGLDADEAKASLNDDVAIRPSGPVLNSVIGDGSDSKEGKMILNVTSVGEESDCNVDEIVKLEKKSNSSSGSVIEHAVLESGEEEGNLNLVFEKSNNSPGGGVKEVQWAAFGADTGDDDFFSELADSVIEQPFIVDNQFVNSVVEEVGTNFDENVLNSMRYQGGMNISADVAAVEKSGDGQVQHNVEYWENQYPGWKFDASTGQWYQIDTYTNTSQGGEVGVSNGDSQISYLQQSSQSFVGAVADSSITESVSHLNESLHESVTNESVSNSNWGQLSTENNSYPPNMVFDPQYPGWYYDTITQEWKSLESYTSSVQSTIQAHNQIQENTYVPTVVSAQENGITHFGDYGQVDNYKPQGINTQNQDFNNNKPVNSSNQQGYNMWQLEKVAQTGTSLNSVGNQQFSNTYNMNVPMTNNVNQHKSYDSPEMVPFYPNGNQAQNDLRANSSPFYQNVDQGQNDMRANSSLFYQNVNQGQNDTKLNGSQGFVPTFSQPVNQAFVPQNPQINAPNEFYGRTNSLNSSSPQFLNTHQFSQVSSVGRSSAGRPPHALVTFGFGGKLIVMKNDTSLSALSYGTEGSLGSTISVLNLMEVVMEKTDGSDYFGSLCKRSFPGPLVGGSVGTKELNKWIDEKIISFDSPDTDYRTKEVLKLLFSLLKIACQYYGKLRSSFGTEAALRENDAPESAVARLFASVKKIFVEFSNYNSLSHCLQKLPSEEQMRANAAEVQRLLISGKKKEALEFATDGQLWGPALVLAAQLGDQYYCETVRQMALRQLVAGSPLRTLCLLIAGQPAEVFSSDSSANNVSGHLNMFPQPVELQHGVNSMLDHWEENLAVITANRTKDDELVLVHLGDSLWKNRSDIIAAHICYLVADANFEPHSDSARMCLIGADHWKFPRTYASPDAIQRTELYEYSKVLGNSQFILLSFQPYKFLYALMLAEVGKVTESYKYCQAVLKSLKPDRSPEVETLRQLVSTFEERLKTHQQGGYSSNLAPAKLAEKLRNLFDSTAHRVIGGLPPPIPSPIQSGAQINEQYHQHIAPSVITSQSTMAMSSLMPSASTEYVSEWAGDENIVSLHNRSASEPDIGATPRQNDKETSSTAQGKPSAKTRGSRFGSFGFGTQLLQKTVGLVMKPRQDKQAKLGDSNKFYYDEKLKRWVEEGVEPPAEEAVPPPPPTTAAFQNGISDYNMKIALNNKHSLNNGSPEYKSPSSSEHSSGIPPIPTGSNQFSARGRMGVRSRYVDTFNKGGGNSANLFQSPAVSSIKPATNTNPKFFVPSPVSLAQHSLETTHNVAQEATSVSEVTSIPSITSSSPSHPTAVGIQRIPSNTSVSDMTLIPSYGKNSFPSPPPSSVTMQRYPSLDNITRRCKTVNGGGLVSSNSRRTASWSGNLNDASTPPNGTTGLKPPGGGLGMPPSMYMPANPSTASLTKNGGSFGEDLQEVEL